MEENEDIKIIEEITREFLSASRLSLDFPVNVYFDDERNNAIQNILARYKELEKENKILKSKQTKIITDSFHEKMAQKFNEEFISKSKVKEKIKELDKEIIPNFTNIGTLKRIFAKDILQQLLED